MDESSVRTVLLAATLVIVGASVVGVWLLTPGLRQAASPVLTDLFCENVNGSYTYGAVTTKEFCSAYRQRLKNVDPQICVWYPEDRQASCRDLANLLEDRFIDCLAFPFTGSTDFPDGAPQLGAYCEALSASATP
ncbi:hypothetical protein HY572_06735 [Candidatus Micrarchaeota archaeon]|nr:hypothetical protein [Candidatus Micrarchaeota archaeon]